MDYSWLTSSWTAVIMVVTTTVGIYLTLIILTRIAGLRSFSKMSSFDFAITVSFGSIIAGVVMAKNPPMLQAVVALATLYVLQMIVGGLRGDSTIMSKLVDNQPLLLMKKNEILEDNLKKAKVTHSDLRAKLREANVTQLSQVKAVVMEATGDISVMHNDDPNHELDDELLQGVRGWNY